MEELEGPYMALEEEAEEMLKAAELNAKLDWAENVMEAVRQVTVMVSTANKHLTTRDWNLDQCHEFADDLKEAKDQVIKSLGGVPYHEC